MMANVNQITNNHCISERHQITFLALLLHILIIPTEWMHRASASVCMQHAHIPKLASNQIFSWIFISDLASTHSRTRCFSCSFFFSSLCFAIAVVLFAHFENRLHRFEYLIFSSFICVESSTSSRCCCCRCCRLFARNSKNAGNLCCLLIQSIHNGITYVSQHKPYHYTVCIPILWINQGKKRTQNKKNTIHFAILYAGVYRIYQAQHRMCTAIMIHHKIVINMNMRETNAIQWTHTLTHTQNTTKPWMMRMQHFITKNTSNTPKTGQQRQTRIERRRKSKR